jgi:hypothetical protein
MNRDVTTGKRKNICAADQHPVEWNKTRKEKMHPDKDNPLFPEIHGNFGFGRMRLPMTGKSVDLEPLSAMADEYLRRLS